MVQAEWQCLVSAWKFLLRNPNASKIQKHPVQKGLSTVARHPVHTNARRFVLPQVRYIRSSPDADTEETALAFGYRPYRLPSCLQRSTHIHNISVYQFRNIIFRCTISAHQSVISDTPYIPQFRKRCIYVFIFSFYIKIITG